MKSKPRYHRNCYCLHYVFVHISNRSKKDRVVRISSLQYMHWISAMAVTWYVSMMLHHVLINSKITDEVFLHGEVTFWKPWTNKTIIQTGIACNTIPLWNSTLLYMPLNRVILWIIYQSTLHFSFSDFSQEQYKLN